MNNKGNTGITAIPLLASLLMVSATTSTVIMNGTDGMDFETDQTLNEVMNEITTYLKITSIIGRYSVSNGTRSIDKIAILAKQFITNSIKLADMTIQIKNNNDVIMLGYSGYAIEGNSELIFDHQIWGKTNNAFSIITIIDEDRSLLDYGILNDDTAFIIIKLPAGFKIGNGETISVKITPPKGVYRSFNLVAPSFHASNIISFEDI